VDWIEENCDFLSNWPANSPDLNPIETLWAVLKHSMPKLKPKTVDALKEVVQQAWDTIFIDTINRLCSGLGRQRKQRRTKGNRRRETVLIVGRDDKPGPRRLSFAIESSLPLQTNLKRHKKFNQGRVFE
jgi:hypothetical protein